MTNVWIETSATTHHTIDISDVNSFLIITKPPYEIDLSYTLSISVDLDLMFTPGICIPNIDMLTVVNITRYFYLRHHYACEIGYTVQGPLMWQGAHGEVITVTKREIRFDLR